MMTNSNIPVLRFPEFTGKWLGKELGDVAKISSGGTPSRTNPHYWDGNIPWVSTTLIDFNTIIETSEYITPEGLKNSSAKLFPVGTLLIALYGQGKTRGKVALLGIEATTNQACGAITPKTDTINEVFLFQNLAGRYDEIRNLSNQGGQENLSGELIKRLSIVFPSLPEQTKIATFLTAVDDRLNQLKQKKTLLEQYKKGVLQKIFDQEIRFKDDDGNEFPGWEVKTLGEATKSIHSGRDKAELTGEYNLYGSTGVIGKNSNFTYEGTYILIARVGANAGTINLVSGRFCVTDNTLVVKVSDAIDMNFCYYLLIKQDLSKLVFGSGQPLITGGQLKLLSIQLPSLSEQTKIANFLSAIDEKISLCDTQIAKTEQYKKGLLQQMFV